ncbi:MAG: hypothetical protein K6E34_08560 [Lachnospiraceae bacterium]|nr:hypothetical protein [Lachnospiraceae bacterium]
MEEFLKKHGCEASFEDLKAFFEEKREDELDMEELKNVAGGENKATILIFQY